MHRLFASSTTRLILCATILLLTVVCLKQSVPAKAQQVTKPDAASEPLEPNAIPVSFSLERFVLAKVDDKGNLQVTKWNYAWELQKQTVAVTREITQQQTRRVKNADGKVIEETYNVQVPVTEMREVSTPAQVPKRKLEITVPIAEVIAWDLAGERLRVDQLKAVLTDHPYAIILQENNSPHYSKLHRSALHPKLVFVYHTVLKDADPPIP